MVTYGIVSAMGGLLSMYLGPSSGLELTVVY
jgi:hypothetical protein